MKTGIANLPLHYGEAPAWLFQRMKGLARGIVTVIVEELGPKKLINKLSDPFWFQSFGCILGFDWHSSGLTTTTLGALKEGLRGGEADLGIFLCGGKGRTSRKTPEEIRAWGNRLSLSDSTVEGLIYASRMSAKVDSAALQDGYQIYHHVLAFTNDGYWSVIQQGMNTETSMARRYHWLSSHVHDFVEEPHSAICTEAPATGVLNMVARESVKARAISTQLVLDINTLLNDFRRLSKSLPILKGNKNTPYQQTLYNHNSDTSTLPVLEMPSHHPIYPSDFDTKRLEKIFIKAHDNNPHNFEELLYQEGVGPKTIRALALVAEIIYGARASFRDPARFSFAHGGKDGYPYPVDPSLYDQTISLLEKGIKKSKVESSEKYGALRRLQLVFNY
ncbi:MAG TPA: DUF763 domain-containing protein [Candidatus Hypogeohydataceae bacterium YC41]